MMHPRTTLILTAMMVLCLFGLFGCGSDKSTNPSTPTVTTTYVDINAATGGDGTQAHPYQTITQAIDSAGAGGTIHVAAGTYSTLETFPLMLKPGQVIIGSGRTATLVNGAFQDENAHDNRPITLRDLYFEGFYFARDSAPGTPSGPNLIHKCNVYGNITIGHGGKHHTTVDSCTITGSVDLTHGPGTSVNIVRNNIFISGSVYLRNGSGSTDTVSGNQITNGSIVHNAGATTTLISGNTISQGQIIDNSGAGTELIVGNVITFQPGVGSDSSAVVAHGVGVTLLRNTINVSNGASGINALSGPPTIIDSNGIHMSSGSGYGIYTKSGNGEIIGDTVIGGYYGIYDKSGATSVSGNVVHGSVIGIYAKSLAAYRDNSVMLCSSDGVILDGVRGPFERNEVVSNTGCGVRIMVGPIDLGGGADSGVGLNVLQGNAQKDLCNESSDSVYAKYNYWDHNTVKLIDSLDISDDDEYIGFGKVIFEPFH